jgi:hypothetical protein
MTAKTRSSLRSNSKRIPHNSGIFYFQSMRYVILLLILLAACRKPVDPGARYLLFATQPTLKHAMACVATYEEFCKTYHYPISQRNRQWIQRLRITTARKFMFAYKDAMLNEPLLRKLTRYKKPRCTIKKNSVIMSFSNKTEQLHISLDSCRISPSGRILPCVFSFHIKKAHPKRVN